MADISKINLNNQDYNIKDEWARTQINALGSPMNFLGISDAAITAGGTETPSFNKVPYAKDLKKGDVVVYGTKEFVWDGAKWVEFGDTENLGSLAYQDSASGSYKPEGTVTVPITPNGTVSGGSASVSGTVSVKGTPAGSISSAAVASGGTATYTPAGTISAPGTGKANALTGITSATFAGDAATIAITAKGTISSADATTGGNYTPKGTVSISGVPGVGGTTDVLPANTTAEFTGTLKDVEVTGTPTGNITSGAVGTGTANYTPAGTITMDNYTPAGTVAVTVPSATTQTVVTGLGEITTTGVNASITGETLTLSTGTVSVTPSTTTVVKSIPTITAAFTGTAKAPTGKFAGTGTILSFTGTPFKSTGQYTPAGSVALKGTAVKAITSLAVGTLAATFAGQGTTLSFAGQSASTSYTPAGTVTVTPSTGSFVSSVSAPTFTGTGTVLSFKGSELTSTGTATLAGTVSGLTFNGSATTHTGTFTGKEATITVS